MRRAVAATLLVVGAAGGATAATYETDTFGPLLISDGGSPASLSAEGQDRMGLICAADGPCDAQHALQASRTGRQIVGFSQISPYVAEAVVAIEDHGFWERKDGVSARAIYRAAIEDAKADRFVQGGSTIDRQLAGLEIAAQEHPKPPTGFWDKLGAQLKEARRAKAINEVYLAQHGGDLQSAKRDVLTDYLNTVYLGRGATGIEAAARAYFGISAAKLTQSQSIFLAGLPQQPSNLDLIVPGDTTAAECRSQQIASPACAIYEKKVEKVKQRYGLVLDALRRYNGMSAERAMKLYGEVDATVDSVIPFRSSNALTPLSSKSVAMNGAYAARFAAAEAKAILDTNDLSSYVIQTTIQTKEQKAVNGAIQGSDQLRPSAVDAGAIVVAKDGSITAWVGSKKVQGNAPADFVSAIRDAGSTLKPLYYAKAFDGGLDPDQTFPVEELNVDSPYRTRPWQVHVERECAILGKPDGCSLTPEEALAASSNTVSVKVAETIGIDQSLSAVKDFGINMPAQRTAAMLLGTGGASLNQLAQAYNGLLMNGGQVVQTHIVKQIRDLDGNIIYNYQSPEYKRVVSADAARKVIAGLKLTNTIGTAQGMVQAPEGPDSAGGKTGTSGNPVTDLHYVGSECIQNGTDPTIVDGRTIAIDVGNPNGGQPIPNGSYNSSREVAGLFNAVVQNLPHGSAQCDIADAAA